MTDFRRTAPCLPFCVVAVLILHTGSIWLTVPIAILTYLVFFVVVQWVLARGL